MSLINNMVIKSEEESYLINYFNDVALKENHEMDLELEAQELSIEELEYIETEKAFYESLLSVGDNYKITNEYYIKLRKNRELIKNSFTLHKFLIGDILEFAYFYKNAALTFSGVCISIKKKGFILPDLSLILRNIVIRTGMEITYSYFYNRAYKQKFLDYKRKIFTYNKNKLYFIRNRLNSESRVN